MRLRPVDAGRGEGGLHLKMHSQARMREKLPAGSYSVCIEVEAA